MEVLFHQDCSLAINGRSSEVEPVVKQHFSKGTAVPLYFSDLTVEERAGRIRRSPVWCSLLPLVACSLKHNICQAWSCQRSVSKVRIVQAGCYSVAAVATVWLHLLAVQLNDLLWSRRQFPLWTIVIISSLDAPSEMNVIFFILMPLTVRFPTEGIKLHMNTHGVTLETMKAFIHVLYI